MASDPSTEPRTPPLYAAADFCLIPFGTGSTSVGAEIAEVQRVLESFTSQGLIYKLQYVLPFPSQNTTRKAPTLLRHPLTRPISPLPYRRVCCCTSCVRHTAAMGPTSKALGPSCPAPLKHATNACMRSGCLASPRTSGSGPRSLQAQQALPPWEERMLARPRAFVAVWPNKAKMHNALPPIKVAGCYFLAHLPTCLTYLTTRSRCTSSTLTPWISGPLRRRNPLHTLAVARCDAEPCAHTPGPGRTKDRLRKKGRASREDDRDEVQRNQIASSDRFGGSFPDGVSDGRSANDPRPQRREAVLHQTQHTRTEEDRRSDP